MGGYCTEITASETASVRIDGKLYHLVGRYMLTLVAWMGLFREGKIPPGIDLLLRCRRPRGIHPYVSVTARLDQDFGKHHVGCSLDIMEILGEGSLVFQTPLVRMKVDGILQRAFPFHEVCNLGYLPDIGQISSGLYGLGQFEHGTFSHPVGKVIGSACDKDGRHEAVFPVIVMGKPSQRGLYPAYDHRDVRIQLLQDSGVQMITLHGRTKTQGYTGDADWNMIENCAKSLDIPLIGNGSVEKLSASELRDSACAGFMVGRAARGNPWIFCRIKKNMKGEAFIEPSPRERAALALKYAETLAGANFSGISSADLTHAKGQIMRFLRDGAGFKKLRRDMRDVLTIEELKELLCEYV